MGIVAGLFFGADPPPPNEFPISFLDAIVMLVLFIIVSASNEAQEEEDRKKGIIRPKPRIRFEPVVRYEPVIRMEMPKNDMPNMYSRPQIMNQTPTLLLQPPSEPTNTNINLLLPPPETTSSTNTSSPFLLPPSEPTQRTFHERAYYCPDRRGFFLNRQN